MSNGKRSEKTSENEAESDRRLFAADGFHLFSPMIPREFLERVIPRMDAIIAGDYDSGTPPHAVHFGPEDRSDKLKKVDQPHLADPVVYKVIAHPAIGCAVAGLLDASFVQVWAVQLLVKPPGRKEGHVGWHQDMQHWNDWWRGEVGTIWIAVSDIGENCGPMKFVRGSHRWGLNSNPSFFGDPDHSTQQDTIPRPAGARWEEVPALLPAGAASFHHRLTYHGSGSNLSDGSRRSFAIHVRTERSEMLTEENYYTVHLQDDAVSPVIYSE